MWLNLNTSSKVEVKELFSLFSMPKKSSKNPLISIGALATRTGLAITAIRYYESEGLIRSTRNASGHRRFVRSDIRRLSFVKICQSLGFSLNDIHDILATLPNNRTPNKRDWERLSQQFSVDIDKRIVGLQLLKENLNGCIGCGCLSMAKCRLYNPDDRAAQLGSGPRFLLGNTAEDLE